MATPFNVKKLIFSLITLLCVVIAVLYTLFSARSRGPEHSNLSSPPAGQSSSATAGKSPSDAGTQSLNDVPRQTHQKTPSDLSTGGTASATASKVGSPSGTQAEARQEGKLHAVPRLVAINLRDSPDLGKVEFAPLDAVDEQKTPTDLHCERVYFAANKGICLSRQIKMLSAQTVATLVDANFQPITTFRTDGIPTRARISPDGRFAAFTVFVTGHSYTDVQMSTATLLLNIEEGKIIANLEEFKVFKDGNEVKALDFNYWGVTFQRDSNFFYATLRTGGTDYLVHGDIKAKTVTVIYQNVDCPSLSPDETRIAFKKMLSRNNWRLSVLDLKTLQETPLAETRIVDDQAEWLDNHRVLYALPASPPWMDVMVVSSDGSGEPKIFAKGVTSPAVVR